MNPNQLKILLLVAILVLLVYREVQIHAITETLIENQNIINRNTNRLNTAALKQGDDILARLSEVEGKLDDQVKLLRELAAAKPDHSP